MATPITLKLFKNGQLVSTKNFDRDIIKIGRLASAHLSIEDEKVSRIHAVIDMGPDGSLSITDMGSVEGTFVNGAKTNKSVLKFGDRITVGQSEIVIEKAPEAWASDVPTREMPSAKMLAVEMLEAPPTSPQATVLARPQMPEAVVATQVTKATKSSVAVQDERTGEPVRARPSRKRGSGPLGLEVRLMWGAQTVAEHFLAPGKPKAFTVGSDAKVDFVMGDDKFSAPLFEAVKSDGSSFSVRFTSKMKGELHRKDGQEVVDLKNAISSGMASNDSDAYSVSLQDGDFIWVDLGGVVLEAFFQPVPKPVVVPLGDTIDFNALNILLVLFFLGALFVITAINGELEGDEFADDLNANQARLAKLLVKPEKKEKNKLLDKYAKNSKESGEKAEKHRKEEGQMGKKEAPKRNARTAPKGDPNNKDQARMFMDKAFGKGGGGLSTVFGKNGLGGELQAAMGNMFGATAGDAQGMGGLGLRGSGSGGGGQGNTIGIGGIGTKGRGGGTGGYGNGVGVMGGKKGVNIGIEGSDALVTSGYDKELIRQVIKRNSGQIRYCYESQLSRHPNLNGKVAVKFVISAGGTVASAAVAQSTVGNSEL